VFDANQWISAAGAQIAALRSKAGVAQGGHGGNRGDSCSRLQRWHVRPTLYVVTALKAVRLPISRRPLDHSQPRKNRWNCFELTNASVGGWHS